MGACSLKDTKIAATGADDMHWNRIALLHWIALRSLEYNIRTNSFYFSENKYILADGSIFKKNKITNLINSLNNYIEVLIGIQPF